eukprot:gb/GECG01012650.1/.p1 GENE.gb/GECG01012650.1/~~gb/GECG01012650.1/.p1  ORF type:complete len:1248 (+),score=272.36 gb/GECG01012650.1/:1-3744(+)
MDGASGRSASVRRLRRAGRKEDSHFHRPRSQGPTPSRRQPSHQETPRTMEERLREQRQRFRESKEALNRSYSRLASPRSVREEGSVRSRRVEEESRRSPSVTKVNNPISPARTHAHTVHKPQWHGSGLPTDSRLFEVWGARKSSNASPAAVPGRISSTAFSKKLKESTPLALRSRRVSRDPTDRRTNHSGEDQHNGHAGGDTIINQLDDKSVSPARASSSSTHYARNSQATHAINSPLFFGQEQGEDNDPVLLQAINHFVHQFNQDGNEEQLRESERIIKSRLGNDVFEELLAGLQNAPSPSRQREGLNSNGPTGSQADGEEVALKDLQQRNVAHRERIVELQKTVQQLRVERDDAHSEAQRKNDIIRELETKVPETAQKAKSQLRQHRTLRRLREQANEIGSAFNKLKSDFQRHAYHSNQVFPATISDILDETEKQDRVLSQMKKMMEQFSSAAVSDENSERKIEQLTNEREELKRQLESEKSKQARNTKQHETQMAQLEEEVAYYKDTAVTERQEKESIQERWKTEKNRAIDTQQKVESLQQELARQKEETEQHKQEEGETLRTENKKLESMLKHKDEELSNLKDQIQGVDNWKYRVFQSLQSRMSTEVENCSAALEYELKGVEHELKQKQVTLRSLEKQVGTIASQLPLSIDREISRRKESENELVSLKERMKNLEKELREKEELLSQESKRVKELERHLQEMKEHLGNNDEDNEELSFLRKETENLQRQLAGKDDELQKISSEVEDLRQEKEQKDELKDELQKLRDGTEEDKENLRKELETTQSTLQEKEQSLLEESKRVKELEENLQQLKERLHQEGETEQVRSLQEETETLRKQITEKNNERALMEEKLQHIQERTKEFEQSIPKTLTEFRIEYDATSEDDEQGHKIESASKKIHELLTSINKYKATLKQDIESVSKAMNYSKVQERLKNSSFSLADILELSSTLLHSFARDPAKSKRRSSASRQGHETTDSSNHASKPAGLSGDEDYRAEGNANSSSNTTETPKPESGREATNSVPTSETVPPTDSEKPPAPRPPPRPRDHRSSDSSGTHSTSAASSTTASHAVTGSKTSSSPPTPPRVPAPPRSAGGATSSSTTASPPRAPQPPPRPPPSQGGSSSATRSPPGPPPSKSTGSPTPPTGASKPPTSASGSSSPQAPGSTSGTRPQPPSNSPPKPRPPSASTPKPQPPSNPSEQNPGKAGDSKPPTTPPKPKGSVIPRPPPSQSPPNKPKPPSAPPPSKKK